jgi:two-component system cell cycle sensor histidine kinase/response regulator CckA
MPKSVRLLIVEGRSEDAERMILALRRAGYEPTWERVESVGELAAALAAGPWDAVLTDNTPPEFGALAALRLVREADPDLPVIAVSGAVGEEAAVEVMRAGASDYVLKHALTRLAPAVERALQQAADARARRAAERDRARLLRDLDERVKELRALHQAAVLLQEGVGEPAVVLGKVAALLPPAMQYPEVAAARIACRGLDVTTPNYRASAWRLAAPIPALESPGVVEVVYLEERPAAAEGPFLREEREVLNSLARMLRAYLEHNRATEALRASEARFKALVEKSFEGVVLADAGGVIRYASPSSLRVLGYDPEELVGRDGFALIHPEDLPRVRDLWVQLLAAPGATRPSAHRAVHKSGATLWLDTHFTNLLAEAGVAAVVINFRDATERVAAEAERQRMMEELARTSQLLRAVADNTSDAIFVKDRAGKYLLLNPAAARFVGRPVEEVLGRDDTAVFDPDSAQRVMDRDRRVMAVGEVQTEEEELTAAGVTRVYEATKAPFRDEHGNVAGLVGISRDVTAQKRAEAALRESEERYRTLLDRIPDPLFVYDRETLGYLAVNEAAVASYGYTRDEFLRMTIKDVRPPEDVPALLALLARTAGGFENRGVWRHRKKDGTVFDAEINAHDLTLGGRPACVILARDVTERKRSEQELRLRDRAIRAVTQGILITDPNQPDNPIVYASRGFERITGYAPGEVIGRNCRFLQGKDTDPDAVARVRQAIRAAEPCTVELLNYRKDGTPFWNELSVSPVRDEAGRLTHFVGVQADVTGRRRLEEQFRQAQKMEAIGQLAGGVAHDFNNLLTIINGYSDLLLQSLSPGDPAGDLLAEIRRAGERSAGLTRQLLAFSRKQVLAPRVLDLNTVVADAEKMLRRVIGEDVRLATALEPGLGAVRADPGQLEQVLLNLAVNARDAMPTGGRLTIETRNVELDEDFAQVHPGVRPGPHVLLAVSDTGCGMTPEVKAHIFEPFFTTKGPGKGTGLGLATVFGIVHQSGGAVGVYTEVGVGTTFKVYLPQVGEAAGGPVARSGLRAPPRGVETVLLVEDEDGVRSLARHVLTGCGYTVLEAADGEEAVRVAGRAAGPIHLLVTDVVMPGPGGREVAERVRDWHPGVRVLYVSGYTEDAVVRHGVLQDGVNFLQKPFSPLALAHKVREVLDAASGRA